MTTTYIVDDTPLTRCLLCISIFYVVGNDFHWISFNFFFLLLLLLFCLFVGFCCCCAVFSAFRISYYKYRSVFGWVFFHLLRSFCVCIIAKSTYTTNIYTHIPPKGLLFVIDLQETPPCSVSCQVSLTGVFLSACAFHSSSFCPRSSFISLCCRLQRYFYFCLSHLMVQ